MVKGPVVLIVGGPDTGKTKFYTHFTKGYYSYPTKMVKAGITVKSPSIVLVDTPGRKEYRGPSYSWSSFQDTDLIVNFGNWDVSEIHGIPPIQIPKIIHACNTDEDTMKRIVENLQECYPYSYFS